MYLTPGLVWSIFEQKTEMFLGFFQGGRPLQTGGGGSTDREIKNAPPWGTLL